MRRVRLLAGVVLLCAGLSFTAASCKKSGNRYGDGQGQLLCPVMASPINRNIYVDYQGKRIYFCCAGCPEEFRKDPAKYMKNLEGVRLDTVPTEAGKE